jgi:predicted PurR-regulated permease PerM
MTALPGRPDVIETGGTAEVGAVASQRGSVPYADPGEAAVGGSPDADSGGAAAGGSPDADPGGAAAGGSPDADPGGAAAGGSPDADPGGAAAAGAPETEPGGAAEGPQAAKSGRPSQEPPVPRLLQRAAAWSWRLLVIGLLIYVAFRLASALRLVVLPCVAALLLAALLQPLTARLRRTGLPPLAATWCTVLAAVVVLAGVSVLAANRVSADYPRLHTEVKHTAHEVQASLASSPFHLNSARLEQYSNDFVHFLSQHKSLVAGTVVTGGKIFLEILTGLVLMIFVMFFLLKDGERIWAWLVKGLRPDVRERANNAGSAAWTALVNYMRGTTAVAAIHAVVIGLALWVLGVPLLVPLIILVFLAAFVPLVGILVAGALAILVTLGTKGWVAALILLGIFLLENQVEGHLLQPLVVGRIVRLHPLAIILVLAVGGIIAGIAGAIVAVPFAAALCYAWPHLRRDRASPPHSGTGGSADGP